MSCLSYTSRTDPYSRLIVASGELAAEADGQRWRRGLALRPGPCDGEAIGRTTRTPQVGGLCVD